MANPSERTALIGTSSRNVGNGGSNPQYRYVGRRSAFTNQTTCASGIVLLSVVFEKIAFYALVGNLVLFLNVKPLHWLFYNAANALYVFTAVSYMFSIVGGWVADSCLGRYKTIVIFYVIYMLGYIGMPIIAPYPQDNVTMDYANSHEWCGNMHIVNETLMKPDPQRSPSQERCSWAVYLTIVVVGIGSSGIKANTAPFGADQVKTVSQTATRAFFNWYYWCINIGSFVALGLLAYVQQDLSFFWGYIVPIICLVLSAVIYMSGAPVYVLKPPTGSIISNIFKIVKEAGFMSCKRQRPHSSSFGSSVDRIDAISNIEPGCLDRAKVRFGGSFHDSIVDDVKALGKVCCIFLALIPYWVVYLQMSTTFVIQGLHMKLKYSNDSQHYCDDTKFNIPAAWLSLFDVVFLILLIPLLDRIIYPALDRHGYHMSLRVRIVVGMVFAVMSVCCAGGLEIIRMNIYWKDGHEDIHWQCIGQTSYRAAKLSIFWQVPQYALIGASEALASIAGLELAYIHAPRSMQGLIMGLFWFVQGLGSLLGTATMYGFNGVWFFTWDNGDINCRNTTTTTSWEPHDCHLDYYFFFLAGLLFLSIIIFIFISWWLGLGKGAPARHSKFSSISPEGEARVPTRNEISSSGSLQIDRSLPFLDGDNGDDGNMSE